MAELSEKDMKVARKFNLFNPFKLKKFVAVYNKMCPGCKQLIHKSPREIYDIVCSLCKPKLERLAEKVK